MPTVFLDDLSFPDLEWTFRVLPSKHRTANGKLGHFPICISYQNTVAYGNTG